MPCSAKRYLFPDFTSLRSGCKQVKSNCKRHERVSRLFQGQIKFSNKIQFFLMCFSTAPSHEKGWQDVLEHACERGAVMLVCRHKCAELVSWMVTHWLLCKHLQDTAVSWGWCWGHGIVLSAAQIIQQRHGTGDYPDWCNRRVTSL